MGQLLVGPITLCPPWGTPRTPLNPVQRFLYVICYAG